MLRGALSIVIGLIMVVGGLTGHLALRGTQSGGALAAVGGVVVVFGIVRIIASKT